MKNVSELFESAASPMRAEVLDHGVKVEFIVGLILTRSMGLNDFDSRSFSSSSSLSFSQKINLLLDFKLMESERKAKFLAFAEIRNEFAHKHLVRELKDCKTNSINKLYNWYGGKPTNKGDIDLYEFYHELYKEIQQICSALVTVLDDLANKKFTELERLRWYKTTGKQIDDAREIDADFNEKIRPIMERVKEIFDSNEPEVDILNNKPLI